MDSMGEDTTHCMMQFMYQQLMRMNSMEAIVPLFGTYDLDLMVVN